jgi:hypothetical protein
VGCIEQLDIRVEEVHFDNPHLLSGTWAESLNIIRRVRRKLTYFMIIRDPSGAEFNILSDKWVRSIFNAPDSYQTLAAKYMMGLVDRNPITGQTAIQ